MILFVCEKPRQYNKLSNFLGSMSVSFDARKTCHMHTCNLSVPLGYATSLSANFFFYDICVLV